MLRLYINVPTGRGNAQQRQAGVRQVNSQQLLGSTGELLIEHHGQWYRLRETRARKLILTK